MSDLYLYRLLDSWEVDGKEGLSSERSLDSGTGVVSGDAYSEGAPGFLTCLVGEEDLDVGSGVEWVVETSEDLDGEVAWRDGFELSKSVEWEDAFNWEEGFDWEEAIVWKEDLDWEDGLEPEEGFDWEEVLYWKEGLESKERLDWEEVFDWEEGLDREEALESEVFDTTSGSAWDGLDL